MSLSSDIYFYEPAEGHGLTHDPFNAIIGPRPIGGSVSFRASLPSGSVRSRAKMRQNHKGWCLMNVKEPPHLVGWRET
jgi:hypothetical protein